MGNNLQAALPTCIYEFIQCKIILVSTELENIKYLRWMPEFFFLI